MKKVNKIKKTPDKPKTGKRIKAELPSGFRDFGPEDAIIKNKILQKVRGVFENFGYDPMETPAVERTEVLTGGEKESGKIIFNVKGSQEKKSDSSLRFDLTVPLARFLTVNPDIPKPFKRYQIGCAWRGESPQAGRYREFTQADIDIVGSSSMDADAEVIFVMYQVFKTLGLNKFLIKINNRKLLNGFPSYAGFPEKKLPELLRIVDKKDKIGEEAVKKEITKIFKSKVSEKTDRFLKISGGAKEKILQAREIFKGSDSAQEGIEELIQIVRNLNVCGVDQRNWELDFSVVRGLEYYTGPVFETVLTEARELGSIFSGGRYNNLFQPFTGQKIPAVGASLGVDRLLAALDKLGLLKKSPTILKILILNLSPELKSDYWSFAKTLREAGFSAAIYLGDDRAFQAQLAYAVKKEIPYVLIYGENEKKKSVVVVKDMVKREQKEIPKGNLPQFFGK